MAVWRKAHARDDLASLAQRRVHGKLVVVAMQIFNVLSDYVAFEILPRTIADTIACINGRFAIDGLRTQIGAPSLAARAMSFGQLLAISISALDPAKIGAFP